ncbi:Arm DNA-binding domain-containing protein [Methylobacterium oryzae CBMB20]
MFRSWWGWWGKWWGRWRERSTECRRGRFRRSPSRAEPGRHADGDGLYLVVDQNGGKRWVFLYRLAGRRREMGLGSLRTISLAKARELASRARTMVAQRQDPVEARQAEAPSPARHPYRVCRHSPKWPKPSWMSVPVAGAAPPIAGNGTPL